MNPASLQPAICLMNLGVVVIGRNEGERLERCLTSIPRQGTPIVYVDSGSVDGSVARACALGADIVELDAKVPFTAARARNAGFAHLLAKHPELRYVQFVDGDCELMADWLERGLQEMEHAPELAIAFGRVRERFPNRSIYNRLCDLEWNGPAGETASCGGIAMIRARAFQAVGGFNPRLIAGEEPEVCLRLRRMGWRIRRLDAEMAIHDAAMTRFSQWWQRARRAGYAYAEGAAMHGHGRERHWVRETRSAFIWGLATPFAAAALAWPTRGATLLVMLVYPAQLVRILLKTRARHGPQDALLYAAFCLLAKLPQAFGGAEYRMARLWRRPVTLIEHKQPQNMNRGQG